MNEITWTRRYCWSLRRELWEHPSLWIAPLVAAAVALIAALISSVRLPMAPVPNLLDPQEFDLMSGVIMFAAYAAAAFYALDTLFGERRDRSILFWKSLPVSDVTTVLAKLSVPLLVVPVITAVITVVAFTLFAPLTRVHAPIIRTSELLLYHLVTVHSLWWAPFFAWLLFISVTVRRAPFVWAVVPVLVLALVEPLAFGTSRVAGFLARRFSVTPEVMAQGVMPTNPMTRVTPGAFVQSAGLWIGLAVATVLVIAAVRRRRGNGPI